MTPTGSTAPPRSASTSTCGDTPGGDKYVTVLIDRTAIRDGTGPARLLDMVEGRAKQAFNTWLSQPSQAWRERAEVVAMYGFTGSSPLLPRSIPTRSRSWITSTSSALPGRHSTSHAVSGWRSKATVTTRATRSAPHAAPYAGADLLTDKQAARLRALFADEAHVELPTAIEVVGVEEPVPLATRPGRAIGRIRRRLPHPR
jgi:hypothetical protein